MALLTQYISFFISPFGGQGTGIRDCCLISVLVSKEADIGQQHCSLLLVNS